jgi:MFS family permease
MVIPDRLVLPRVVGKGQVEVVGPGEDTAHSHDDRDDDPPGVVGEAEALLARDGGRKAAAGGLYDLSPLRTAAAGRRRRAELRASALMVLAGALVNGGYNPTESYRTAVFGALGYYSSFVLYFCMSFGSLFVPWVVARCSLRTTMTLGAALYVPFGLVFALALATGWGAFLFLPTAAVLGCGASVFRTTQTVYIVDRARGYDAARRAMLPVAAAAALPSSRGSFLGAMSGGVSAITLSLDIAASFSLQRGMTLATLFTLCAAATSSSVVLFALAPTKVAMEAAHPLPRAAALPEGPPPPRPPTGDLGAVLRLMCSSSTLQWMLLAAVCSGTQGSYAGGSLNADIIAPSLGVAWVGYTNAFLYIFSAASAPLIGHLSDRYGRLPTYCLTKSLDLASALFVGLYVLNFGSVMPGWLIFGVMGARGVSWGAATVLDATVSDIFVEQEVLMTAMSAVRMTGTLGNSLTWLIGPFFSIEAKSMMVAGAAGVAIVAMRRAASRVRKAHVRA